MLIGMSCINMEQWETERKGFGGQDCQQKMMKEEEEKKRGNEKQSMNGVGLTECNRAKYAHTHAHKQKVAAHGKWKSRRKIKRYLETHCYKERRGKRN